MGTTKSGIWFPEPGDTYNEVSTLATMASSIEETVASKVSDTDWISMSPSASGWEVKAPTAVRVDGGKMYLKGYVYNVNYSGGWTKLFNWPSGVKPAYSQAFTVTGNTTVIMSLEIRPDGLYVYYSTKSGAWLSIGGAGPVYVE